MDDVAEKVLLVTAEEAGAWRCESCGSCEDSPQDSLKCHSCAEALVPQQTRGDFIGDLIDGRYEIIEQIGAGAWGVIYKARQVDLDRIVAIKILKRHLVSDKVKLSRFRQEALAASKLVHQNITQVFDYGIIENKQPYFVMEYVEGQTLSAFSDNAQTPSILTDIFAQVLSALSHAHSQGIVHRDLKPGNILILKNGDGNYTAKLLDFGIARLDELSRSNLTATGELLGTPLYMSPEQCLGQDVDARSDLYSLGCVFFECLSGHAPFLAENSFNCMMLQLKQPPPLLTLRNGSIADSTTQNFIRKSLAKDKALRFQSAAEMACEVESLSIASSNNPVQRSFNRTLLIASILLLGLLCQGAFQLMKTQNSNEADSPPSSSQPTQAPKNEIVATQMVNSKEHEDEAWNPLVDVDAAPESYTEKLKRALSEVEDYAAAATAKGDIAAASKAKKAVDEIDLQLKSQRFALPQANALDMVRVQDGKRVYKFDDKNTEAVVEVTAKGYEVELLLCGNTKKWIIKLAPGVRLKSVWKWFDSECSISGLPEGVPVRHLFGTNSSNQFNQYVVEPAELDSPEMYILQKTLKDKGLSLSSAQLLQDKQYQCIVGPESLEWLSARLLPRLESFLSAAQQMREDRIRNEIGTEMFWAVYHDVPPGLDPLGFPQDVSKAKNKFARFDFTGPIDADMFEGGQVHTVAGNGKPLLFALTDQGLKSFNTLRRSMTQMKAPSDIPDPLRSSQIAYDPVMKRLLCLGSHFETYDLTTSKWNVASSFRTSAGNGMAFAPERNVFYAFGETTNISGLVRHLYKLDTTGKVLEKIRLSRPIPATSQDYVCRTQLFMVKEYLVVVTPPSLSSQTLSTVSKVCVIDPPTGKVLYFKDLKVHR